MASHDHKEGADDALRRENARLLERLRKREHIALARAVFAGIVVSVAIATAIVLLGVGA